MSGQLVETGHPTNVRSRVLRAVEANDITRNRKGIRWWTSETEYRLLTAAERRHLTALMDEGLVRFETAGGYPNGWSIGGYCLAPGVALPTAERCDHCGQMIPHAGSSWRESGACQRAEALASSSGGESDG